MTTGSDSLELFGTITGRTAEEFADLWRQDASQAFNEFITGLGNAGEQGTQVLAELIGENARTTRAFLSLAQSSDILTDALGRASQAYEENNALVQESNQFFASSENRLKLVLNQWRAFGKTFGDILKRVLVP